MLTGKSTRHEFFIEKCQVHMHFLACELKHRLRWSTTSQVYVHHYVSSSAFLLGNGAELRGSFTRQPVKEPYALVIDTAKLTNDTIRQAKP